MQDTLAFGVFCEFGQQESWKQKKEDSEKNPLRESGRRGSNPRPSAWKANALSTELLPHSHQSYALSVGKDGFEPPKA